MKILDLTLPTPEENLACDEALLDLCEDGGVDEILRFWQPLQHFVVLGYSNKRNAEINEFSCAADQIPVLRRTSGGGTVLQGPGCLNYTLVLRIPESGPLTSLVGTNCHVMKQNRAAVARIAGAGLESLEVRGTSDLCLGDLKVSGNAQRRKRSFFLFHGTFLLGMDLSLIEKYLAMPERQPEYRAGRAHRAFVRNLSGVSAAQIKAALAREWGASGATQEAPTEQIQKLISERYTQKTWNEKF